MLDVLDGQLRRGELVISLLPLIVECVEEV